MFRPIAGCACSCRLELREINSTRLEETIGMAMAADRLRAAIAIDLWPAQSLPLRFILRLTGEFQHRAATSRHPAPENAPRSFCESNRGCVRLASRSPRNSKRIRAGLRLGSGAHPIGTLNPIRGEIAGRD